MNEAQRLSKLLWDAREHCDMLGDIVGGRDNNWPHRTRNEIDAYRAEKGWSPHGFGGEKDAEEDRQSDRD